MLLVVSEGSVIYFFPEADDFPEADVDVRKNFLRRGTIFLRQTWMFGKISCCMLSDKNWNPASGRSCPTKIGIQQVVEVEITVKNTTTRTESQTLL